jgi:hypothetical protein
VKLDYLNKGLELMRSLVSASPQNREQKSILAAMLAVRGTVLIKAKQPLAAIEDLEGAPPLTSSYRDRMIFIRMSRL